MFDCITCKLIVSSEKKENVISEIPKIDSLIDYFYLFYEDYIKLCLVGVDKQAIEMLFNEWKQNKIINDYIFIDNENTLDISKIIACASRKISEYLKEKVKPLTVDNLVNELVELPEINAEAYSPLHFILNQLQLLSKEAEIRFKLKTNPRYLKGYKVFNNILLR